MHEYGEIPNDVRIRPYLPLMPNMWRIFQKLGWERTTDYIQECEEIAYLFFEGRLNESINTSRLVLQEVIKEPEKVLSFLTAIPPITIRSDLLQGTIKLLGGDSLDVTWVAMSDFTQEVFIFLNTHLEDGIPVDWWIVNKDDELLDRRHMKLGHKIKDLPRKLNDFTKFAMKATDVLRDIRNERTPEWATSDYIVAPVGVSYAVDLFFTPSNFECLEKQWLGFGSKEKYKLPDYMFTIYPFFSLMKMMFVSGRESFISKASGLATKGHLYLQPLEKPIYDRFNNNMPVIIDIMKEIYSEGIPFPIQTIKSSMPNEKKKSEPDIRFQKTYPNGKFITLEDIDVTFEEALNGVYTDITIDTDPSEKIDESRILSKGIGTNTVIL